MMNIFEKDKEYISGTYARFDVNFVSGKGSILIDSEGKSYIDFSSGIAVAGLGHANEKWLAAVTAQAGKLAHISNLYYTEPCVTLAEKLCERTGMKKVFFCNSGAEANECAIKTARKYAVQKGIKKPEIVTLKNSFHGRTLLTLTATGQKSLHPDSFAPYIEGFRYASADDFSDLGKCINANTAAIMIELVQGEGGVIPLKKEFVIRLSELCSKEDILLIIDEVQTGNGRTGSLYAYQQYGINPDIVTTAKGLGNGLPIGATMFGERTKDVLVFGDHGSTFGANPVCCAGAIAVLEQLDGELLSGVKERHDIIVNVLKGNKNISEISGMGLMLGLAVDDAKAVAKDCLKHGLVVLTAHDRLRLLPPLNISIEELTNGLNILNEVLK